jgi:hypothetical protein
MPDNISKETVKELGEEFVRSYVSSLIGGVGQHRDSLRIGGAPLEPNKYLVTASQWAGNAFGGI